MSWGISLVLHTGLLLVALALAIPAEPGLRGEQQITVRWIPTRKPAKPTAKPTPPKTLIVPPKVLNSPKTTGQPSESAEPSLATSRPTNATFKRRMSSGTRPFGVGAAPPLPSHATKPHVGQRARTNGVYRNRGIGKTAALRRYGGSRATEDAVARGLRWLANHQDPSGGWSAGTFPQHCGASIPCSGRGGIDFDVGVSALALLAFLGDGPLSTTRDTAKPEHKANNRYAAIVDSALDYFLRIQEPSGGFGIVGTSAMYNHAISTLAIIEASALTGDQRYRDSAERALSFSAATQQSGGGWDYTTRATGRNDLSITGWQVLALRAAETAGFSVPESPRRRLEAFLNSAFTSEGIGIYANLGTDAGRRGINMVAVGVLSKLLLSPTERTGRVRLGVHRLLQRAHAPSWSKMAQWDTTFQSYYYWYTATMALFLESGGSRSETWGAWNHLVKKELLTSQSSGPHVNGSWPPEPNWIGVSGGRVYATALNVLTLETYYRYEPTHFLATTKTTPIDGSVVQRNQSETR